MHVRTRSRVVLVCAAVMIIAAVAAGCSGGSGGLGTARGSTTSDSAATDASSSSVTSDSAPRSSTTERATSSTSPSASTSTTAPVDQGDHGPQYFTTPSKNIGCYLSADQARCDVADKTWTAPPATTPCSLDYGHGVILSAGAYPTFTCAGDTTLGGPDTLGYGQSAQRGHLRCDSAESGVTCTDLSTGHAFTVSREAYGLR